MSIDTFAEVERTQPPTEDELVRNNRYNIDGKWFTRASTFAKTIDDDSALTLWKQRAVALGIAQRRDLQLAVAAARDDKKQLNRLCDEARNAAQANEGRDIGTSLHALVEKLNRGEHVDIVEPWASDLAAYRSTLTAAGVTVVGDLIERVVVCDALGVAGRFDLAVRMPGYDRPLVADLKTGGYLAWLSFAVQLAVYARADKMYDRRTGTLVDKPAFEPDAGVIIHLPEGQGRCDLYIVDLAAGWQAAQMCASVRKWRTRKDLAASYDPAVTLGLRRAFLQRRIERLRDAHPDALTLLAATWPSGVPTLKESADHDAFALSLVEKAVIDLEARFSLPYLGNDDPAGGIVAIDAEAMIARLKALPPDLLAVVEAEAKGKVPHLKSLAVRREHLDALEQLVGPVEAEAQRRRTAVREAVVAVLGDDEHLDAVAAYLTAGERDASRLTEGDVDALGRLCAELADGRVVIGWDDDGVPLLRVVEAGAA